MSQPPNPPPAPPPSADAWMQIGLARHRAGDMEGAKTAMRHALQTDPHHRDSAAYLGAFLRVTGEGDKGEQLLRAVLRHDPAAHLVRLILATDLLQDERAADAWAVLDESTKPPAPWLQRWQLLRALALIKLHRPADARAVLAETGDVPADLQPQLLWRQTLLAIAESDPVQARQFAERAETVLRAVEPALFPEEAIVAHFDLAKFWSGQQEPGRAVAHWTAGHKNLQVFQPFSRPGYRAFIDTTIECFSRARLHEGPRAHNTDPAPVFIVGMPRSGTTLCEQILAAHHAAQGAGERAALGRSFLALGGAWEDAEAARRIAALAPPVLDGAAAQYLADLHGLAPDARYVVDKMPGNFRYLGLVGLMLPGARIIHCVRDPRDIGFSIFTYRFHGYHPYAHDLADMGWYIGEHDRLMAHWRTALPNPILTVALRDWVEDFQGTLARMLDFLDLPHDPACERFHENSGNVRTVSKQQVRQPVNARGLNRWQAYAPYLQPLLDSLREAGAISG